MYFHEAIEEMKKGYICKTRNIYFRIITEKCSIGDLIINTAHDLQIYETYSKMWDVPSQCNIIEIYGSSEWEICALFSKDWKPPETFTAHKSGTYTFVAEAFLNSQGE